MDIKQIRATIDRSNLEKEVPVDISAIRFSYILGSEKITTEKIKFVTRTGYRLETKNKEEGIYLQYLCEISSPNMTKEGFALEESKYVNYCFEIICLEQDIEKAHKKINSAIKKLNKKLLDKVALRNRQIKALSKVPLF